MYVLRSLSVSFFEARRAEKKAGRSRTVPNMYYVYLLKSLKNPSKKYIGYTTNIDQRLEVHNSGGSIYTKPDRPWKLITYLAFDSEQKAIEFEKYIKIGSGYAFAKRRLW